MAASVRVSSRTEPGPRQSCLGAFFDNARRVEQVLVDGARTSVVQLEARGGDAGALFNLSMRRCLVLFTCKRAPTRTG